MTQTSTSGMIEPVVQCANCLGPCCDNFTVSPADPPRIRAVWSPIALDLNIRMTHGVMTTTVRSCAAHQADGACGSYTDRPYVCRQYDCRADYRTTSGEIAPRCVWPRQ